MPDRNSLASLLIATTVVAIGVGLPKLRMAVLASAPFVAVGVAATVSSWRTRRFHALLRIVAALFGLASMAAGLWVFRSLLPG